MFMDEHRGKVWDEIRQQDSRLLGKHLTTEVLGEAARRAEITIGKSPLQAANLVWLSILAACFPNKDFSSILVSTLKLLADQQGFGQTAIGFAQRQGQQRKSRRKSKKKSGSRKKRPRSKHDPRQDDPTVVSEEAFTKARRRLSKAFWMALLEVLNERFEKVHGYQLCWKRFRLLALDGSCINLDGWKRLRKHYGAAGRGKGRKKTQARMVMLQFPLARLPYAYEVAPLADGETTLAWRLAEHLRRDDLVLIDRGFFSYGLFCRIQEKGAFFGIRLKSGTRLQQVRSLGDQDELVCWRPKHVRQKERLKEMPRQMELRVIHYQIPGFRPSAIVTNMTDPKQISREDWVRMAEKSAAGRALQPGLYHRRWEIETTFFELKVTQGMERGLRSRTPEGIEYEIAGHVILYFLVRWLMLEAALEAKVDPLRVSFAGALRELDEMRVSLLTATPQWAEKELLPRLLQRVASHIVPLRPGRHFPRPNDTKVKDKGKGLKQLPAKLVA
jgi:Transposase DDE domain